MSWEYTRILVPVDRVIEEMNLKGQDNWRVINVRHVDPEYSTVRHRLLREAERIFVDDMVAVLFERQNQQQ
jgi:hypothetical protein